VHTGVFLAKKKANKGKKAALAHAAIPYLKRSLPVERGHPSTNPVNR
jgi:hypothetical protein